MNIINEIKLQIVTNASAYCITGLFTTVKSFIVHSLGLSLVLTPTIFPLISQHRGIYFVNILRL